MSVSDEHRHIIMDETMLKIRVVKWSNGNGSSAFIFPDAKSDPNAHTASKTVKSDLTNHLNLVHADASGMLAFAEMSDTFKSEKGNIFLLHDADPGDLALSASNEELFHEVINKLSILQNYVVEYVNGT